MRVWCANDADAVDWVIVTKVRSGLWCFQDGSTARSSYGTGIPQTDLTSVTAADDEVRMEGREARGEYVGSLTMEGIFWARRSMHIPKHDQARRVICHSRVLGMRRKEEFWEMR